MKLIALTVGSSKPSKYGGMYRRVIFRGVDDNKTYRLDVYENHVNSRKWGAYIKPQAIFDNVSILRDNIVNGNSNFVYIGQRHDKV